MSRPTDPVLLRPGSSLNGELVPCNFDTPPEHLTLRRLYPSWRRDQCSNNKSHFHSTLVCYNFREALGFARLPIRILSLLPLSSSGRLRRVVSPPSLYLYRRRYFQFTSPSLMPLLINKNQGFFRLWASTSHHLQRNTRVLPHKTVSRAELLIGNIC